MSIPYAQRRENWIGFAGVAAVTAVFFWRACLGQCFYAIDFHLTFEPLRSVLGESLRAGSVAWNPWISNGTPLSANPLSAASYPPTWLFAVLDAAPALTLLTVLHVLFGAWGAWVVARRWNQALPGATVAAMVFGFNGIAASATAFTNLCWSAAWLPWVIVAWDSSAAPVSTGPRWWRFLPLAGATFMLLALGEPFVILPAVLGVALLSIGRVIRNNDGGRARMLRDLSGLPVLGAVTGALLAAPSIIATLRYMPQSLRGFGFEFEGSTYWSMSPARLIEMIAPGAFGEMATGGPASFWAHALSPERGHPLFFAIYAGSLTLALAAVGVTRRSPLRWPLIGWCGLLMVLALGDNTPVYALVSSAPMLDTLRFPTKWALAAMLPLGLLAGFGIDALARGSDDDNARRVFVVTAVVLLGSVGVLSAVSSPGLDGWLDRLAFVPQDGVPAKMLAPEERGAVRSAILTALLRGALPLVAGLFVVWLGSRWRHAGGVAWALVAIVSVDLVAANSRQAPTVPPSFYTDISPAARAIHDDAVPAVRVYAENPVRYPPGLIRARRSLPELALWQRDVFRGYSGVPQGLRMAFNADTETFNTGHYARLKVLLESAPLRERLMLLGSAGVTHVVTHRDLDDPRVQPIAVIPGDPDAPQRVYRNVLARPRAWIVPAAEVYDADEGFIRSVSSGADDLFERVVLIDRTELDRHGISVPTGPATGDRGDVDLVLELGDTLVLRTAGDGGLLVVSDSWLTGWSASVDGAPAPLLRANYAFRAVPVPAGGHDVLLTYDP